jgi:hypothetical protein
VGIKPLFALFSESDSSVNGILKLLVPAVKLSCLKGQQGFSILDFVPRQRLPCQNAEVDQEDWLLTTNQVQRRFLCSTLDSDAIGLQGHRQVVNPVSLHLLQGANNFLVSSLNQALALRVICAPNDPLDTIQACEFCNQTPVL